MSASSKKKLRKEEAAAKMTEKQLAEQKEAKKLKTYSIAFGVVIGAMLIFALVFGVTKTVSNSGILERNTVAVTVGDHEISNAELNMYYIDAVNEFYNNYGSYAYLFGLDTTKPLNEQVANEETGATWADDFLESAKENLKSVYTLCDMAEAEGYTLSEAEQLEIDNNISYAQFYAMYYYGYTDTENYLKAMYGSGCTEELYREYLEMTTLANSYYANYTASLTYEDADLRAYEADIAEEYSSYSYSSYTLSVSSFLTGGTTDDEGNTTYTDEEQDNAVKAAEEAAKLLTAEAIVTLDDLNAAIAGLEINAEAENPAATTYTDHAYDSISTTIQEWVTDEGRVEGDLTYIPSTTTSTDEEGNEVTTTNGYIVVMYHGVNDNTFALANVRHILISYTGGTTDESGNTVYSEDEMKAAEAEAADILAQWETAGGTEEAFIQLANEHSADAKDTDGDGTPDDGGIYEDVYPGQMVTNFNDWCFDEARQPGDTGLVQTDYGWHVMYYVGDSETNYRDYLITQDMKAEDTTEWYNGLLENVTVVENNVKYIQKDLVLTTG